jgi:hypothetical protein
MLRLHVEYPELAMFRMPEFLWADAIPLTVESVEDHQDWYEPLVHEGLIVEDGFADVPVLVGRVVEWRALPAYRPSAHFRDRLGV